MAGQGVVRAEHLRPMAAGRQINRPLFDLRLACDGRPAGASVGKEEEEEGAWGEVRGGSFSTPLFPASLLAGLWLLLLRPFSPPLCL